MSEKKANRNATPQPRRERQRGRILTEAGWNKLDAALQAWEVEQDCKRTFERIAAETQLDPGTVAKIFKRKEGADLGKLERLFETFQLMLEAADHRLVPQGTVAIADPNFVGRTQAITDLNRLIDRDTKVIVIQARGGVGKTTLARKYLQQEFESILEFPIAKETKDIASIESLIEEKLRQLGEEPGREFFVSLDRLKQRLQAERIGILIDNLEPALDAAGKLIEPHRRYVELLRVLADPSVQAVTLITSRERLNEYSVSVQHYLLEELSLEAWNQFFQHRFAFFTADRDVSDTNELALTSLHKAYGGNAKAMDILCGAVLTDYSGSIEAYWQANQDDLLIERALEDLVVGQFDRLQLDPNAYNLLCRMGCYRYQDVPTVPIEGLLCLLWDAPEHRQRRVVKSLQERSLVEFENGKYWLHPVIRAEAIDRLRRNEDWKISNHRAAEFWTKSVEKVERVEDALEALESYHHYVRIQDFDSAGNIILKHRPYKGAGLKGAESLGRTFYRLGLCKQMSSAITRIIDNLNQRFLYALYHILGDLEAVIGSIHHAEELYRKSGVLAYELSKNSEGEDFVLLVSQIESLFNIGFCKMQLGEIREAITCVEEVLIKTNNLLDRNNPESKLSTEQKDRCQLIRICAWSYLGFLHSEINDVKKSMLFIKKSDKAVSNLDIFNTLSKWVQGFCLLSLGSAYKNLDNFKKSLEVYKRGIDCLESNYLEIKANMLTGIATLHQNQKNFQLALSYHLESIKILGEIGAKCDLAEAYYQFGLAYQKMGDFEKSNTNFQEAVRLFTEMEAPKQVERVKRSMES